jgi:hypothetical protein
VTIAAAGLRTSPPLSFGPIVVAGYGALQQPYVHLLEEQAPADEQGFPAAAPAAQWWVVSQWSASWH